MALTSSQASKPPVPEGPPYRPISQILGQTPSIIPDVPINSVFLLLFLIGGASHMFILKYNARRGRKFNFNGMTFGFCVTRVSATSLRMAWAAHPRDVRVAMAAIIFVYAGVILLFIANLFFTQRVIRAQHPHFGWSKAVKVALPIMILVILGTFLSVITSVILAFYTLDASIHAAVRDIQIFGSTLYVVAAFIPIPIIAISLLVRQLPRIKKKQTVDKFGNGSIEVKMLIVVCSSALLTLGTAFRSGTTWIPPVSNTGNGTWYFSRGAFYAFNFSIEVFVVYLWLAVRIDKRFIVPDGAEGPYSYGNGFVFAGEAGNEEPQLAKRSDHNRFLTGSQSSGFNPLRDSNISPPASSRSRTSSLGAASYASWGGISAVDVTAHLGEDGIENIPYYPQMEMTGVCIDGADQEMGWDPKSGKWVLRPVSLSVITPASTGPDVGTNEQDRDVGASKQEHDVSGSQQESNAGNSDQDSIKTQDLNWPLVS